MVPKPEITLLRHGDHPIEQIAAECGFRNYLTHMFSKYRRTTPTAFRSGIKDSS